MKGENNEIHTGYITKNRKQWYKLEYRDYPYIMFGVFFRDKIKVIRNYTKIIPLTTFHNFYPNELGMKYIDKLFLFFLGDIGQDLLKLNRRVYGNGLFKFEPNDLNNIYCPDVD